MSNNGDGSIDLLDAQYANSAYTREFAIRRIGVGNGGGYKSVCNDLWTTIRAVR